MKKSSLPITLIISLVFSFLAHSQELSELPNFAPPSPQASAFSKYGNQEINESSGKVALSIPIITYKAGKIEVPVTMNYMGSGVKVNSINTWTGINWTLNAGGVITRTVYHEPDEQGQQRIFKSDIDALGLVSGQGLGSMDPSNDAQVLYSYFNENGDTQPDIFEFSFLGYNGSFYLDENFVPVLINNDKQLKIEILGPSSDDISNLSDNKEFKITTQDGVAYYFGGNEVEVTSIHYSDNNTTRLTANTGYYLYRIAHPIKGQVFFEYDNVTDYDVSIGITHSIQEYVTNLAIGGGPFPIVVCDFLSPTGRMPYGSPQMSYNKVENGKFLKRIYSPDTNGNYVLNFNSNSNVNGNRNFKRVLNNIELVNDQEIIQKIDFSYIFDYHGSIAERFFLESIEFDNGLDLPQEPHEEDKKRYEFKYKQATDLPKRFAYAQDHYGYYNGAVQNSGFFPPTDHPTFSGHSDFADRNFDFEKSLYGTLTEIIYPTGGTTVFEYESHKKKKVAFTTISLNTFRNNYPLENNTGAYHIDKLHDEIFMGEGVSTLPEIDENGDIVTSTNNQLLNDQTVTLKLTIKSESPASNQEKIFLKITNLTATVVNQVELDIYRVTNGNLIYIYEVPFTFNKNNIYKIELDMAPVSVGATPMHAQLSFKYASGEELVDGGSLRVKKSYDMPSSSEITNIKRYYYAAKEDVFKDPLEVVDLYIEPKYVKSVNLLLWSAADESCPIFTSEVLSHPGVVFHINPVNILSEETLNRYKEVTISYGGNNFEEGGIEKQFMNDAGGGVVIIKDSRIETSQFLDLSKIHYRANWLFFNNGKLNKETILIKKLDTLFKVKQKALSYIPNRSEGLFYGHVGSFFFDAGPGFNMPYTNVGLGRYEIISKEFVLDNVINTDYIDPFPVAINGVDSSSPPPIFNESNYRKIVTNTDFEYNSDFAGQPTKIISTTSNNNEILETRNYYLDEVNSLSDLDNNLLPSYNALLAANRVDSPIQSENYTKRNGVLNLLSTNRTLYGDFSGKIRDSIIQTSKGNNALEDRIVFEEYDLAGNLKKVKYQDGSITFYDYNGFNQVLKKVDNYVGLNPNPDLSGTACENRNSLYQEALVTSYVYDQITLQIKQIIDPRCNSIYYEYDGQQRLKYIKDDAGNILSKNEYNYELQN